MKKGLKIGLFCLSIFGLGAIAVAAPLNAPVAVMAEGEEAEAAACTVVVDAVEHAKITTSIQEGAVGDVCVINVKEDLFYKTQSITVNGTALIESETTYGEYSFALAEGENKIVASVILDEEAVGVFYNSVKAIENKDWSALFSVQNIMSIIAWLLNGTCLIAMVRYFIKDKRLAAKVEKGAKEAIEKVVPEETKQAVLSATQELIAPLFAQMQADNLEIKKGMALFAKCMALMQENSPESRVAILNELSGLNLGTENDIYARITEYIENLFKQHEETYNQTMAKLAEISANNEAIINENKGEEEKGEEEKPEEVAEDHFDGTQI